MPNVALKERNPYIRIYTMTQTLSVEGMSCKACVGHVKHALESLPGVESAMVSLANKQAVVEYDNNVATLSQMVEAVEEEGYSASPQP